MYEFIMKRNVDEIAHYLAGNQETGNAVGYAFGQPSASPFYGKGCCGGSGYQGQTPPGYSRSVPKGY